MPIFDLLTVGESFQDLIFVGLPRLPKRGEELKTHRFTATIGGGAVITAAAGARLGLRTAVVSALSREAVRALRRERVTIVNLTRASDAHAISVSLSTKHDRSFVTFNGVNDRLERRLPAALARQRAMHVHFAFAPRDCARWARRVERLRARGVTTSWDFGWNPYLRAASGFRHLVGALDFVFVNEAEVTLYATARRAARNTVIKLGARGSRWLAAGPNGFDLSAPAPRVRAVETTGAGDAFNGGFLFGLLRGRPARECLQIGNFVGARSTLAPGGLAALPTSHTRPRRP